MDSWGLARAWASLFLWAVAWQDQASGSCTCLGPQAGVAAEGCSAAAGDALESAGLDGMGSRALSWGLRWLPGGSIAQHSRGTACCPVRGLLGLVDKWGEVPWGG